MTVIVDDKLDAARYRALRAAALAEKGIPFHDYDDAADKEVEEWAEVGRVVRAHRAARKPEYPHHCTTPEPCIAAGRCTRDPNCID